MEEMLSKYCEHCTYYSEENLYTIPNIKQKNVSELDIHES